MKIYVHAPDSFAIPGSLCESEGDTATIQNDVDCPECLDMMDASRCDWNDLTRTTIELRSGR